MTKPKESYSINRFLEEWDINRLFVVAITLVVGIVAVALTPALINKGSGAQVDTLAPTLIIGGIVLLIVAVGIRLAYVKR